MGKTRVWAIIVIALLSACANRLVSERTDPKQPNAPELFRLRAECANQARTFEAAWQRENADAFNDMKFRNHYHESDGRCFVEIIASDVPGFHWYVKDALEGVDGNDLVWRSVLKDDMHKSPVPSLNSEGDDSKALAKIAFLMGDNDRAGSDRKLGQ